MKNIIRKILKEEQDEFEWVKGLDVESAEKEIYKPFNNMSYEWNVDGKGIYDTLIKFGVRQPTELKEIGEILEDEFGRVYDNGRDDGLESCDCEGCCDDYYYYEEVEDMKEEAEDRGYERGYETGVSDAKGEAEDEIEELRGQINELQSEIEDLRDRLSDTDDDLD